MQVKDVMNHAVLTVARDLSLRQAARRLGVRHQTLGLVCEGRRLVGLFTMRDLIMRGAAAGRNSRTTSVREVMTRDVICTREEQDVRQTVTLMQRHGFRRLPVVDRQQHVVGLVRLEDVLSPPPPHRPITLPHRR